MEIIILVIAVFFVSFSVGAIGMAGYKNKEAEAFKKLHPIEKPRTIDTLYADRVINTASMIYCNYNESKIIRPGHQDKEKKQRQGEAIQEALNLVRSIYNYFDILDNEKEEEKPKNTPLVISRPNDLNIN